MASGPITSWQIDGDQWKHWLTLFFWAPKSLQMVSGDAYSLEGMLTPWKGSYDQPRQHIKKQRHYFANKHIKKQRHYFANKGPSSQGYGFSSGHV